MYYHASTYRGGFGELRATYDVVITLGVIGLSGGYVIGLGVVRGRRRSGLLVLPFTLRKRGCYDSSNSQNRQIQRIRRDGFVRDAYLRLSYVGSLLKNKT